MADRSIIIKVGANVTGYVSALKTAAKASADTANKASDWATKHKDGINELSNGLLKAGLVVGAFTALAVTRFSDFDSAMSGVAAATMETTENMALLRQASLEAGAASQYSASEAAGAVTALAKAGVKTADILGGGLTGALNLAASAQMDVGEAAEITATALNQYGLRGKDASHVSDLLAASAGKAMGDVTDMAGALKYVGPVAHQMGISIEQTAGTIAYLAQQGVLGEQAGTSLRGMLTSLTSPSKVAAKEMENLGINVYDASGQFVGFNGVAQQLQDRMKGLTNAERDESLGRIFGNEQITTARLLYAGGAKAVDTWTASVNDSGYAAEQARIKTDNLKGDVERLGGSLDTALIQSGSGANNVLRQLAQGAEAVVDQIGQMPEPILNATTLLTGAGGLAALGLAGMGKLAVGINDAKVAVQNLGIGIKGAALTAGLLGGALAIGTLAFAQWAQKAAEAKARAEEFQSTLDGMGKVTTATMGVINKALSESKGANFFTKLFGGPEARSAIDMASRMGIAIEDLQGAVIGQASSIDRVNAAQKAYVADGLKQGTEAYRSNQFEVENLNQRLAEQGDALTTAQKAQAQKTLADEAAGVATDEATTAVEKYADAQKTFTVTTENYTDALKELIDAQNEAAGVVRDLWSAQNGLEQATADAAQALKDNGATLDVTSEKGRANRDALLGISAAGDDLIESMRANGATQEELQGQVQSTRDRFLAAATQFGLTADEANALADQLNLIPGNIDVQVAVDTASAENAINRFIITASGRRIRIGVDTFGGSTYQASPGGPIAQAGGGYITGPGTGTSDSIAAYLSNGEYVVKAAAVARYGRAMFDGLNAQRYATGGMAGMRPAPASTWASRGSAAATGGGIELNINGPVYARDENALAERLLTKSRDVAATFGYASLGVS